MAALVRVALTAAQRATNLLRTVQYTHPPSCPCHSNPSHDGARPTFVQDARRHLATPVDVSGQREYAFEMAASSIRFGPGCTREVGMDLKNMGAKKVLLVTDANVAKLHAAKQATEALDSEGIDYVLYDKTVVEPKDSSSDNPSPVAIIHKKQTC